MSAQRLSDKKTRKIAAATNLPVLRAWSRGGYTFEFVTADHEHGSFDTKTNRWTMLAEAMHFSTCDHLEKFGKHLEDPPGEQNP